MPKAVTTFPHNRTGQSKIAANRALLLFTCSRGQALFQNVIMNDAPPLVSVSVSLRCQTALKSGKLLCYYFFIITGSLVVLFLLMLRFALPAWINHHPQDLTDTLTQQLGLPATADRIDTEWSGWNPRLTLHHFRLYAAGANDADAELHFPEVTMLLDWRSLLRQTVLLRALRIEAPTLTMRRDKNGNIFVGGILLGNNDNADSLDIPPLARWLRQQDMIEINRGALIWHDEQKNAPPLSIHNLNFHGERKRDDYWVGIRGTSSDVNNSVDDRSTVLDIRARIDRREENVPSVEWYARFEHLNFPHLTQWFDLPITMKRGVGGLQAWGRITHGHLDQLTFDINLNDALADLTPEANDNHRSTFELRHAEGRITAAAEPDRYIIDAKKISFTDKDGIYFPPTDAQLALTIDASGKELPWAKMIAQATHAHLSFDRLQLAPMADLLLGIPQWETYHPLLETLAPKGIAQNGSFDWDTSKKNPRLRGEVSLSAFSLRPYKNYPGMTNFSGKLEFTENNGAIRFNNRNATLDLPNIFPESVPLTQLNGTIRWRIDDTKKPEVNIDGLYFSNDAVEGRLSGVWRADDHFGIADLEANIIRAEAAHAHRYIPLIVDDSVRQWLRNSLLAGQARNGRMILRGPLIDFPFYDGDKTGASFLVEADVFDATMRYDPEWPPIDRINGKLIFRHEGLIVQAGQGEILGASIQEATSVIPDLGADLPHLLVNGSVQTGLGVYLKFLEESPVGAWTNHILRDTHGDGDALLRLSLDMPLSTDDPTTGQVKGELDFNQGRMSFPSLPALENIKGAVSFTENGIHADALSFSVLGNPGSINLRSTEKSVLINSAGTLNLAQVKTHYPFPYAEYFEGETPWTLELEADIDTLRIDWALETPLTGIRIDLPAPLGKTAQTTAPLRISQRLPENRDHEKIWQIEYRFADIPETLRLIAQSIDQEKSWPPETLAVRVDRQRAWPALPPSEGIDADIVLPELNLDLWYALLKKNRDTSSADVPVRRLNLAANTLITLGKTLHDFRLKTEPTLLENPLCAHSHHDCWTLDIESAEIAGLVQWESSAASATENGRIRAALEKLVFLSDDDEHGDDTARMPTTIERGSANPWPMVDVDVAHFYYQGNDVGRATLAARPHETDWRIERFSLNNDNGQIDANGWWHTDTSAQQTELHIDAHVRDVHKFLALFKVPEGLMASGGTIKGHLSWSDSPTDFDLNTLGGQLTANIEHGRFAKIEPGIGRLLGVFSLQALPRRITLDFRDVFSEGFAFDRITGTAVINNGVMHTGDPLLDGPAAEVHITGRVDLINETQDLDVRVRPSMTEGVSLGAAGAATLLMSTPVSAAAVGIGALVGQMILDDPIGKIFSYEYHIEGSWSDPIAERKNVVDNNNTNPNP